MARKPTGQDIFWNDPDTRKTHDLCVKAYEIRRNNMKPEEKLVGQMVKVSHHKNIDNEIKSLDSPKEVVVVGCHHDEKNKGFTINGGMFMTYEESEDYV